MDDSKLHYLTYDPEAIWEEMMTTYIEAGGDILYPGDEKELLLRSVQANNVLVLAAVDTAIQLHTLRGAVGDYLDIKGEENFCPRIQASAATAKVTITTNDTGRTGVLEAGTAMTADGEIFYLLTEDLILTGTAQTVTASVIADRTGSAGNGLTAGTQLQLDVANSDIDSVVAETDAFGGNAREEDEAYRERIRAAGKATLTTGPKGPYEAMARSVSSEILDAKAINMGAGRVGICLILVGETDEDSVMEAVAEALSPEDVRPLNDQVSVFRAEDVPYTLHMQYISDNSSTVNAAIAEAVKEYQTWQDGTIGRAFDPYRLMAALYQAGAKRVIWGEGSAFNGEGDVTYTEITDRQRCLGTISLTAIPGR